MKSSEMIALGLAGLAVWFIVRQQGGGSGARPTSPAQAVREVFDAAGRAFDNGWRYFDDGTAIDPRGNYYFGGQLVWTDPRNTI